MNVSLGDNDKASVALAAGSVALTSLAPERRYSVALGVRPITDVLVTLNASR